MTDRSVIHDTVSIELAKTGDGTRLTRTEQGTYLDGIDGSRAPAPRVAGMTEMVDGLAPYLAGTMPERPR